jgi:LCP family protein required for cell wall assembly
MKWKTFFAAILLALFAGGVGVILRLWFFVEPVPETIKQNISYDEASGIIYILAVGVDDVEGGHRADSIGIAAIDIDKKIVRFMSLPRDTRVDIPGHGWQKINHAFAFGKLALLRQTIVNYLGIPINYHVLVNYDSFPQIVDLIGGVDLVVEKKLFYVDNAQKLRIDIPKGPQHLNGKTALEFVRFRNDALGDIGRVKRQQDFVKAVLKKIQQPSMLPRLPEVAKQLVSIVDTNMPVAQAIQLASYLKDLTSDRILFFTMPGKAAYIGNLSYWIGDLAHASMMLSGTISDDVGTRNDLSVDSGDIDVPEEYSMLKELVHSIKSSVSVLNGDGSKGVGKRFSQALEKLGIDVRYTGNAKHFDYHTSSIMYPVKASSAITETAKALGRICGIDKRLITPEKAANAVTIIVGHDLERILSRLTRIAQ